jgi:hypothetical protein
MTTKSDRSRVARVRARRACASAALNGPPDFRTENHAS